MAACAGEDGEDGKDGMNGMNGMDGMMGGGGVAGFVTNGAVNIDIPTSATNVPAAFILVNYTPPSNGYALVTLSGSCIIRHTAATGFDDLFVSIFEQGAGETATTNDVFVSGSRMMLPGNAGNTGNYFFPISAQRAFPVTMGVAKTFQAGAVWIVASSNQQATCSGRLVMQHHSTQL
ncbi:MAG: hypothetical protein M4D80_26220 [Myxococcota bacterium]|nr:hypothetical protein [Myxococcota bacterium]